MSGDGSLAKPQRAALPQTVNSADTLLVITENLVLTLKEALKEERYD